MLRTGILTTLLLVFLCHIINAQLITPDYLVDSSNTYIQSRAENVEESGWVDFMNDEAPETTVLFDSLRQHAGLGSNDEMVLDREWSDDTLDYTHKRYDQHYKDIKVEHAELTEHLEDCFVQILHGDIVENMDRSVSPSVSESGALQDAMDYLDYDDYAWQDEDLEDSLEVQAGDTSATYYPEGELIFANVNSGKLIPSNYELSWRFEIKALDTTTVDTFIYDHIVYVSADTGGVVKEVDPQRHGTGETTNYGDQEIDTKSRYWGLYYILKTDDHGRDIITKEGYEGQIHWLKGHVQDGDDDWGASTKKPVTAHFVVQEAWDLFDEKFDWYGMDDDGRRVRVWSSGKIGAPFYREKHNNGKLNFSLITFRHWDPEFDGTYTATLDYGGHEYTHGVIDFTSDMVLSRETGAIAESFCDIFGYMVEREHYLNNQGNSNWLIGEDSNPDNSDLRYMQNPNSYNDPDSYEENNYWVDADESNCPDPNPQNDDCGIHVNSGVQNNWFYAMANDIGAEKAARIAFRSMTVYMDSKSDYEDAREGAIRAAIDLFGKCSEEHKKTVNNWYFRNVGEHWNQLSISCAEISGRPVLCGPKLDAIEPISYTATGEPGASFNWGNIPSTWTTSVSGSNNEILNIKDFGSQNYPDTETFTVSSNYGGNASFTLEFIDCDFKPCENIPDGGKISNKRLSIKVYPNPSSGRLNIDFNQTIDNAQLSIIDISGKVHYKTHLSDMSMYSIDLESPDGIYFVRITNAGNSFTEKFILAR